MQLPSFSVVVPKGWSCRGLVQDNPTGSDLMMKDLIATPTADILGSTTYVGIRESNIALSMTQILERANKQKNRKVSQVEWGGEKWVLEQYSGTSKDNTPVSLWLARTARKSVTGENKVYTILASVPVTERSSYESLFTKMMATTQFVQ